ncbi:protein transport protein bet1 [Rhizina undulata]
MDLLHHCCLLALRGNLFASPLAKDYPPQRILDVGTGTGIWAIDIAERTLALQKNFFDFIHLRHIAGAIHDLPKLYRQAFKALKPGGWNELQDFCDIFSTDDDSLPPENVLTKWLANWEESSLKCGTEYAIVMPGLAKELRVVGFAEVTEKLFKLPIGRWQKGTHEKELGMYFRQ